MDKCASRIIPAMISVVIPTLNSQAELARSLAALVPGVVEGVVREVIIADGGSQDDTPQIAEAVGARFVRAAKGRGPQLAEGARAAKGDWLLFLHADTVLEHGWYQEAERFIDESARARRPQAAAFRFALDDRGARPRYLEAMVSLRCALLRLPYGDQGLLISRAHYERLGGFRDLPLMEDVDLVRRIGRRDLCFLRSRATTSADRYQRDGYFRRMLRNLSCLTLYFLRVPPRYIVKLYG
ncbi:TIGR04283 family arsenosugar biosynthesis glycosyltransferase [Dichotomicrobium thermohalophilum]